MKNQDYILTGIKSGNHEVLKTVYLEYFGMIKNLILKNSGTEDDAEDIFQDAMVALFKKFNQTDVKLTVQFKTYLYSVCRNLWLNELKRRGSSSLKLKDYEKHVDIESDINRSWKETQEDTIIKMEEAMKKLGEKCQQILLLFYYQKKSMQEISVSLDYTNADNVKTQKYKCLQQLKRQLN